QTKDPAQAGFDGGSGRAMVHDRVRQRNGDTDQIKRKVREVSRPFPDAEPLENPFDFRDSYREEGIHRGDSIREGLQQASFGMGSGVFHEGRAGGGVSEGLEPGELWDEVKYRIIGYPLALLQMIRFVAKTLYHFAKAVWTGEIFPLRPQKKITDHGKVVGYLDGDKAQSAGRRLALPFILLFSGVRMLDLAGLLLLAVIVAQILVWFGVIEAPGEGFTAIFWIALGVLTLSVMLEIYPVFYKHCTAGLTDTMALLNLTRSESKPDTTQRMYRDDDTLDVKVKRGVEEFAGKIGRKE